MSVLTTLAETFVAVVACGAGQNDCVRATLVCCLWKLPGLIYDRLAQQRRKYYSIYADWQEVSGFFQSNALAKRLIPS